MAKCDMLEDEIPLITRFEGGRSDQQRGKSRLNDAERLRGAIQAQHCIHCNGNG